MKRVRCFVAALLVVTLLLCQIVTAWSVNGTAVTLHNDSAGSFMCQLSGNRITVFDIKNSKTYTYTFSNTVFAYCVSKGKLCAAVAAEQAGVVSVVYAKGGKILGETVVIDKNISKSTDIGVDSAGRIYFINKKSYVDIFDSKGKFIRTFDKMCYSLVQCGGKTYAIGSAGIFILSADSDKKLRDLASGNNVYAVSDNYLADDAGNVFSAGSGKCILSLKLNKNYVVGESTDYILALNGKTVSAYNKSDRAFVSSYELDFTPYGLCANGRKIYLLNKSGKFSSKTISEKVFVIQNNNNEKNLTSSSTKSDTSSVVPAKGLNFGKYKVRGQYIFVEPQTTRTTFKSKITYNGYTLKFNKTSGLGTGVKASFTGNGKTYSYKFVVMGDINGTGTVNSRDVKIMFNCLFGINKVGGVYKTAADMNGDGKLSNADLVLLDKKIP